MEQDQHPNWVEQHAKCNMPSFFEDLCAIIKIDIDRIMQIPGQQRHLRNFYRHKDSETQCRVCRTGPSTGDEERITFELTGELVQVHLENPNVDYALSTQWDADNAQCKIVLNGGTIDRKEWPHEHMWKAVQAILDPLFDLS